MRDMAHIENVYPEDGLFRVTYIGVLGEIAVLLGVVGDLGPLHVEQLDSGHRHLREDRMTRIATWADIDPVHKGAPLHEPTDAVVVKNKSGEHVLYVHEADKASRMLERMGELGGKTFWVSEDLYYMLVGTGTRPYDLGYELLLDKRLPDNSVRTKDGD